MLRKKEAYTVCTPIPGFIPRQLALDLLQSHQEIIKLNPLVLDVKPISAPRNASADEYYSTWYEITERVQVMPGLGKMGGKQIVFNGCFHDMPWGVQSHIYAPLNIDMRNRYRIAGNQPGEPPETRELGLEALGAPKEGLYLREDIEIKCNISLISFVKAQGKAASKEMIARMIRKAELLDQGVLKAMMSPDGRLRTINPNDRSQTIHQQLAANDHRASGFPAPLGSPSFARSESTAPSSGPSSPAPYHQQFTPPPMSASEGSSNGHMSMELPGDNKYYYSQRLHPPPGQHPIFQGQQHQQHQQHQHQHHQHQQFPHAPNSPAMQPYPPTYSPASNDPRMSPGYSSVYSTPAGQPYALQQVPEQPQKQFIAELPSNTAEPKFNGR
jgi:hypothetical protein